jgi:hypothetical protein
MEQEVIRTTTTVVTAAELAKELNRCSVSHSRETMMDLFLFAMENEHWNDFEPKEQANFLHEIRSLIALKAKIHAFFSGQPQFFDDNIFLAGELE